MEYRRIAIVGASVLLCILGSTSANAGWFGYSDYQDCLLGEMNGQSQVMLPLVQQKCLKQFPPPPPKPLDMDCYIKLSAGCKTLSDPFQRALCDTMDDEACRK